MMERRRDRGNELLVAIAVLGTLALALTFGVIVTLSSNKDELSHSDKTRTAAAVILQKPSSTPTATKPAPTTQATEPVTPILPTASDTPIPPSTEAPVTAVPALTNTLETAVPVLTDTPSASPNTPLSQQASPTLTLSLTLAPLIWTPIPSPTSTFTLVPSPTPTYTLAPPPTSTFTPVPPLSPTGEEPAATLTFTPYPSLTPSMTPFGGELTPTPNASGCVIPENWVPYTVQRGDTLFQLALRFKISLDDLATANCITNRNTITAGQIVYAPPGSDVTPPAPSAGTGIAPSSTSRFNCDNPAATITNPLPGTVLSGTFAIYGTATHPDFQFYRLQISGGGTSDEEFATLLVNNTQITDAQLGMVNTGAFAPGEYWLRLTVVDNTGNYLPQCTIRVRFR